MKATSRTPPLVVCERGCLQRQVVFDLDSSCGSRAVWITACWRSINDAIQPTSDALHGGFATDRCGVRPDFADHVADRLRQQQVSIVSLGLAHGQAVVGMADQLRTLVEQAQAAHSQHLDSVLSASPRGEWVDPALRAPVRPVAVFPLPAASEDTITDVMRMCAAHGGGPAVTLCPNSLAVTAAEVCGHARAIRATHPVTRDSDTSSRAVGRFAFPPQEGLPAGGGDPVDVGDANAVKLERQCVVVFGGGMANALYRSTLRLHNVMQSRPADPDVEP